MAPVPAEYGTGCSGKKEQGLKLVMRKWLCCTICALGGAQAMAAEPDFLPDSLPDAAPAAREQAGKLFAEFAVNVARRQPNRTQANGNAALDVYLARQWQGWRGVLSGRLDADAAPAMGLSSANLGLSLREAYVSSAAAGWTLDLGRISVRDGVALGFNPTDVFRGGALLVRRTEDPARLRESRLGVVGARVGRLTAAGEFAAMVAPGIGQVQAPSWHDPRWGAANAGGLQYYAKYAPPAWNGLYTNLVWHRGGDGERTVGLNASDNLGQATVVFAEVARSRQASVLEHALSDPAPPAWHNKLAAGLTLATDARQAFTLEYDYNGAALGRTAWNGAWQAATRDQLVRGFGEAGRRQDPLGRHSLMLMVQWERLAGRDDDLACLVRASLVDRSHFGWCEWSVRKPNTEWSINASRYAGSERSEYGAGAQRWVIGAKARKYF